MKILIINYRYFVSGGPERYMFDLIDILKKNGHETIPFSIKSSRNMSTDYEKYFAEPLGGQDEAYFDNMKKTPKMAFNVLSRLFYSFHVKRRLKALVKKERPDVAYILHHYNKLSPSVIGACNQQNIPTVVRLSDYFLSCPQAHMINGNGQVCSQCVTNGYISCVRNKCIKKSYLASFLKYAAIVFHRYIIKSYDRVSHFVCTNDFMMLQMQKSRFPDDKISIIPTFKDRPVADNLAVKRNSEKYILYFGRFTHEKGVDTLISSYLRSGLHKNDIKLYLIGGQLEELSLKLSSNDKKIMDEYCQVVKFCKRVILNKYISNALFVVHPSRWYENMPNTILEAYSFNKSVITTNIGSLPYLVEDGISGLLYKLEDIEDLSSKLIILSDDKIRLRIEENIPTFFEKYNKNTHYDKLMIIFNNALCNNGEKK